MKDRPSILIVEDESIVAADIEDQLVRSGYEVIDKIGRAEQAVETALARTPDLVLMDISLRGEMDGIEAATQIRDRMETPVVFLTAHSDPATLERAKKAEPSGYLLKPFGEQDLIAAVNVALGRWEVEQRLRETQRVLGEKNDMLHWFVRAVSHDVRGPMNQIRAVVQFTRDDFPDLPVEVNDRLDQIVVRATKVHTLVEHLLTLAKLDGATAAREPIDMAGLVKAATDDVDLSGVEFVVNPLEDASCEGVLVTQVWTNLIGNAVKFGQDSESPRVEVGSEKHGDAVRYYVRDNGPGFDDEQAAKIFQPFERLGTQRPGHGIGLTLVQKVVAAHGGEVRAEGVPGQGAKFWFTLDPA